MRCRSKAERQSSSDTQLFTCARFQPGLLQVRGKTQSGQYHFVNVAATGVAPLAPTDMAKAGARRCESWDAKCTCSTQSHLGSEL